MWLGWRSELIFTKLPPGGGGASHWEDPLALNCSGQTCPWVPKRPGDEKPHPVPEMSSWPMVAGLGLMSTSRGQAPSDPSPLWEHFQVVHRADPTAAHTLCSKAHSPRLWGPLPTPGLVVLLTLLPARSGTVHPWDQVDWTYPHCHFKLDGSRAPQRAHSLACFSLFMQEQYVHYQNVNALHTQSYSVSTFQAPRRLVGQQ